MACAAARCTSASVVGNGSPPAVDVCEHRRLERLELELPRWRQQQRALDDVAQLAHVAGPGVRQQGAARCRRTSGGSGRPYCVLNLRQEVLGEAQHVVAACPQRRQLERDRRSAGSTDPRGTARARPRGRGAVFVAATIRTSTRPCGGGAQAAHDLLLQRAQQLALQLQGEAVDLVEKQRAAGRDLEQARLGGLGVGERAALVTEQLALEQRRGECGAVQLDEGRRGPRAAVVQRPREELFARCRSLPSPVPWRRRAAGPGRRAPGRLGAPDCRRRSRGTRGPGPRASRAWRGPGRRGAAPAPPPGCCAARRGPPGRAK